MNNNSKIKRPTRLSPTLTAVLAIVILLGIHSLHPKGDSNFYITACAMLLAVLCMFGAAMFTTGLNGYGYPRKITLVVVAWRYFLTQLVVSTIFTLVPFVTNWSFKIEVKRYMITHLAVFGLFFIAAVLLVTGKKQMDEAKVTAMNHLCMYIQELRDLVCAKVAGKEMRALAINELDELYAVVTAASPVYSDTLAYIESEIKRKFVLLDECINKLAEGDEAAIDVLADIAHTIKEEFAKREATIELESEE